MRYTINTPLVAATAVREADKSDHILEASTGPPIKLTAISIEQNPSVQSWKRLPLKMIISEMASRDTNNIETEPAHHSADSHIDDASFHTAPIQNQCPGRYFPKKSLADPADDHGSQSEQTCFSEVCFTGPGNEVASLDCQKIFPETSQFSRDEKCSRCADVKKVCPHKYYSTPCAKSRFNCLYGNKVLNKTIKSGGLTGPQTHQTKRGQWLNNGDEVPYREKYQDRKKSDYQSPSSAISMHSNVDTGYAYYSADANDYASLHQHPLDHSPKNVGSPTFIKHVHESTNATNMLRSPSSTYSSVNTYSDLSTENEYEQANHKRKSDSEYSSENRFLHPLVQYKSKHHKAKNAIADLLYTAKSRNVSNWKPDCKYTVNDLEHITPNIDQSYSTENHSSICGNCDSGTSPDAVTSSADPISWYRVKYTRRTRSIRISTKLSGLPESEPSDQIPTDLQQTDCSSPSDSDSLLQNHGLNIVPYLSNPEGESYEQPTSEDLVFTCK